MSDPDEDNSQSARVRLARLRAAAVRLDSTERLLRATRGLRRRLPGDDRFGDPLSVAGDRPVERVGRGVSVIQPRRPSVAHELGLGALQVWQSLSEASGRGRGDREYAILFTDLVGFSSWALRTGDTLALELLRKVGEAVEGAVSDHHGQVVKRLGDGLMAVFAHPQEAVDAALDADDRLGDIVVAEHKPRMRAGVHHGRPRKLGGDFLGVDVNIAARVGEAADAGELLVSEQAAELLDPADVELGRGKRLKAAGAPRDLRVHTVKRSRT